MEKEIKIAVIGGAGKSGKYLVKHLISRGFHVRLLIRNPENFQIKDPLIEIITGNVKDIEKVRYLVNGCQAVMSMLGLGSTPDETSVFSQATDNIIRSMNEINVKRYIAITGCNVDTPHDKKGSKTKYATEWMYKNYPKSTTDKQTEYNMLAASNIDWTLVRLPVIELTEARGKTAVSLEDCPGDKISTADLAYFLTDQLFDDTYVGKAPFLSNI